MLIAIGATAWLLLTRIAHAAIAVGAADPPPAAGIDWTFWSMLAIAVGTGLSLVLHVVAPRTKTTIDDRFRDDLDEILAFVRGSAIPGKPTAPAAPPPGSGTAAMLVILLLGAGGAGLAVNAGCTSAQRADLRQDAKAAVVNCTGQALGATPALTIEALVAIANVVSSERLKCTPPGGSIDWSCVESDAIREGEVIGGCSLVQLLVISLPTSPAPATSLAAAARDPGLAALERFRARVAGGATYHTATGDY